MATLLTVDNLSKSYNSQTIFAEASLSIHEKEKIGVIGRNGAGKSTLFRMIIGEEKCDSGLIAIHDTARLGYLRQQEEINLEQSALDYLQAETKKELWQCAKMAGKFELKGGLLTAKIGSLSGGYRMRLKLSAMLLKEPNLFLLDEPTNYLDVRTQLLLENFLQSYNGAFLIISHDREFLKRTCEETLEIGQGKTFLFPRPIDEYLQYKEEQDRFISAYNKKIDREQKHLQEFVDRFRYKASKAKQAQSKLKAIERLKKIDVNNPLANVRIIIPGVEARKGLLLRCEDLSIGYPGKIVADKINIDINRGERVAILGDNGQGKTTLFKTLAGVLLGLNGKFKWAPDSRIAYYAQHIPSELDPKEKVWRYLRSQAPLDINDEEVLKMAGNFLFRDDELEKDIEILSGGERARLCLAGLLLSKSNVMLLDEPTNHLDFETVEALGRALQDYSGTVLFISHNRTFVNSVATSIMEVKDGRVGMYPGSYEDYIYHLQQEISAPDQAENAVHVQEIKGDDSNKKRYEEIKAKKRKIKKVEEEIQKLVKEKEKLLKKQSKDPKKFSSEDYEVLGEIIKTIELKEEEWVRMEEKMES